MNAFIMVMAGGAVGAGLRYGSGLWVKSIGAPAFLATGFVNLLGSFLIGVAFALMVATRNEPSPYAPLIITGLLGGFTTFSAFSLEMMQFVTTGRVMIALIYALGSVVIGLLAAYLGYILAVKL